MLSPAIAADLDETLRNRAMRNYGRFDAARVGSSLEAAKRLATSLLAEVDGFKAIVDPD